MPGNTYTSKGSTYQGNQLQTFATTSNFPLLWIGYLAGSGVSNIRGTLDAKMQISGDLTCPEMQGKASVRDVSFKIDYLNTTYFIKEGSATLFDNLIDATGTKNL